jgi:hypothetical protein
MPNIAISALPVAATQAGADVLPIVQNSTSTTKQLSVTNLFTNSTLVTPILGLPQSGTLTNCTGLPISTGVTGLGTGIATFLATPSSANLRTALTDETGTGAAVFATSPTIASPTLTTPTLGTPASGTLSNCTGLSLTTGVTGILPVLNGGTGVTTSTGTGNVVLSASPTFTGTTVSDNITYSGLIATTAAAPTVASAATIAPTTPIVFISGTAAVVTITAPTPIASGGGRITLIPTGAFTWTTAGNIAVAGTAVVSRALDMIYDVTTTKWYPSYV